MAVDATFNQDMDIDTDTGRIERGIEFLKKYQMEQPRFVGTSLSDAAALGDVEFAIAIINEFEIAKIDLDNALFQACKALEVDTVRCLVAHGADPRQVADGFADYVKYVVNGVSTGSTRNKQISTRIGRILDGSTKVRV